MVWVRQATRAAFTLRQPLLAPTHLRAMIRRLIAARRAEQARN